MKKTLILLLVAVFGCQPSGPENPYLKPGQGFADVEGGKVWYGVMGEGTAAPYICLHGGPGGTGRGFVRLSQVTEDRPVIMMDQLGGGRSTIHEDTTLLTVENFVEQVRAVKEALNLNEFYLMGHSWGTALALEYYSAYPDGVKGIVFNSPYFSTSTWVADTDTLISTLPDSIQQAIMVAERDLVFDTKEYKTAMEAFFKEFILRTPLDSIPKHIYDTVEVVGSEFIYNYMWGPSEFSPTGTLVNYENADALTRVTVPVLITTGEFDEARPVTARKFAEMVPNGEFLEIPGSGHGSLGDNPSVYIKAHRDFANKVDGKQ